MPRKGEFDNLMGKKFNNLQVVEFAGHPNRKTTLWKCLCDCGNTTIVRGYHLKNGHTKSCGCELKKVRENIRYVNYKNGLSSHRLGSCYWNMINRCYRKETPEYKYYGARNIVVCDNWLGEDGFKNFCNWAFNNGYNDNLSIDRIDNNGNYCPENCRWADKITQANNTRHNRIIKIDGVCDTLANMCRKYNIPYNVLSHKIRKGNGNYKDIYFEVVK